MIPYLYTIGDSERKRRPISSSSWLNYLKELNLVNGTNPLPTMPNLTTSAHIQFPLPHFQYISSLPRPLSSDTPTATAPTAIRGNHDEEVMEWEDEAGRAFGSINRSFNYNLFVSDTSSHREMRKTRRHKNFGKIILLSSIAALFPFVILYIFAHNLLNISI